MMIKRRYWLLAVLFASMVHAAGLMVFAHSDIEGGKDSGEQGVEIDLGMLGDAGEASVESEQAEPAPVEEPEPVVEPEPDPVKAPAPEPVVEPEPVPEVKPVPVRQPEPVIPKQQTEVKVKKQPEKPKSAKSVKSEPAPEADPVISKPVSATATRTAKATRVDSSMHSRTKQSTGSADAVTSGSQTAVRQSYFSMLTATLAKHKRYPTISRRRGEEGTVKLFFVVDRNGRVLDYRISESSGSKRLDETVIRMLENAAPLPPFPDDMIQDQLEVNVPVAFQLDSL